MSQVRKRHNRFTPIAEVEMLTRPQRKKHRESIEVLTNIALTLEKGGELSPPQESLIRSLTAGSMAKDTRLNAAWDILEQTEQGYATKLAAMAPHDLSAYHELINPHEPPAKHHYFMCDQLMRVESGEIKTLIMAWPPGAAKMVSKKTQCYCRDTIKPVGEIIVGDEVVTLEGHLKEVLEVIEVPAQRVYEITLEDGTVLEASNDHSWPTDRGAVCSENLTSRDSILRPKVWEPGVDVSIPPEDVQAEVQRLCEGGDAIAPFIHKLPNARLREEFLIPLTLKLLNTYTRENGKSTRREVRHRSVEVLREYWLLLRRIGVDCRKPRLKDGSRVKSNKLTLSGSAYDALFDGPNPVVPHVASTKRNKWEFMIAGLMTGDGSTACGHQSFHNKDESTIALFIDVMKQDYGITLTHSLRESGAALGGEPCHVLKGDVSFKEWLKERELYGKRFDTKRVPSWVKDGTPTEIAYFLSGCFLTDGTLYIRQPNEGRTARSVHFSISHANKSLIDDYVKLFASIGIKARTVSRATTYKGQPYTYWSVVVSSKKDISRFFNKGFVVGYKKDRFDLYVLDGHLPRVPPEDRFVGTRVVSVTATDRVEDMRCLRVKDDGTFLVNNGHATHNSTYSSRTFSQWVLGRNPDWRVLAVGHSQKFVEDEFSKPNRGVIDSDVFRLAFPDVMLNPMEKGASFWRLDGWRGSYACRGALAGTSGLRAKIVLGDDLYKNAQDAMSSVVRDNIWRWWTSDVMSRRLPDAPIVLVNTLWHGDDVPNRMKRMAEENPNAVPQPFVFINIPAEAGEDDPIGRKPGEWLWCKDQQEDGFYSIQDYITKREGLTPSMWSALYLGQPLDKQGDFVAEEQFQRYPRPPVNKKDGKIEWSKTVMSVDTAQKGNERSDYTAILIFRVGVNGHHYLVDVWRRKESMDKVVRVMSRLMRTWQVNYAIVEDTGMGSQIIENYQGKLPAPLMVYTPSGKGSKDFRFDAAAPWIISGKILFPENAPWLADFINELVAFPNAGYDDQADAFSQYCDHELKLRVGGTKPLKMRG